MALGYADPGKMLSEMSSTQYSEWMVYEAVEPFGEVGQNRRTALICYFLVNMFVGKNKEITFEKIYSFFDCTEEETDIKQLEKQFKMIFGDVPPGERGRKKRKMKKIGYGPNEEIRKLKKRNRKRKINAK